MTRTLQADTFVSALPLTSNADLLPALEQRVAEVYPIGDCKQAGPHRRRHRRPACARRGTV